MKSSRCLKAKKQTNKQTNKQKQKTKQQQQQQQQQQQSSMICLTKINIDKNKTVSILIMFYKQTYQKWQLINRNFG